MAVCEETFWNHLHDFSAIATCPVIGLRSRDGDDALSMTANAIASFLNGDFKRVFGNTLVPLMVRDIADALEDALHGILPLPNPQDSSLQSSLLAQIIQRFRSALAPNLGYDVSVSPFLEPRIRGKCRSSDFYGTVLVVDFDRTYSASLRPVVEDLLKRGVRVSRVRLKYDGGDDAEQSPLDAYGMPCVWAGALMADVNVMRKREVLANMVERRVRRCQSTAINGHGLHASLLAAIAATTLKTGHHITLLDATLLSARCIEILRPSCIVTADDTWPEGRVFGLQNRVPSIKFQDGVLTRHPVVNSSACTAWAVWSSTERNYLLRAGMRGSAVRTCRIKRFDSGVVHSPSVIAQRVRVLFASRPEGRDCPKEDRLKVTQDLERLCREFPWVTVVHKPHPSDHERLCAAGGRDHRAHVNRSIHHLPVGADLGHLLVNSDVVLAWPSRVLFEAISKGTPAAILEYGWRRHLPVVPDCFPFITCYSDLVVLCSTIRQEGKQMWQRQFSQCRSVLDGSGCTPTDIVENVIAAAGQECLSHIAQRDARSLEDSPWVS